jgi:hypothetical protein
MDQLPKVLAAAEAVAATNDAALAADVADFDIVPLFDGAELERI